ncbi:MAG: hypothetical protein ACE5G0_18515 [Rhodothermales bacterium]
MKKLATVFFFILLFGTAQAQENQLQLIFESKDGTRLARSNSVTSGSLEIDLSATCCGLLDANGDGIDDL